MEIARHDWRHLKGACNRARRRRRRLNRGAVGERLMRWRAVAAPSWMWSQIAEIPGRSCQACSRAFFSGRSMSLARRHTAGTTGTRNTVRHERAHGSQSLGRWHADCLGIQFAPVASCAHQWTDDVGSSPSGDSRCDGDFGKPSSYLCRRSQQARRRDFPREGATAACRRVRKRCNRQRPLSGLFGSITATCVSNRGTPKR